MRCLSDIPLMEWSRPPADIPWALRNFLTNTGTHEVELESVAMDLMDRYADLDDLIPDQF
jgi:hypothetical protein